MLLRITETMTLKEIMELDPRIEEKLSRMGLADYVDLNETIKKSCDHKGLQVEVVLKELNNLIEELKIIKGVLKTEK